MKIRMLFSAIFKLRNLGILLISLGMAYILTLTVSGLTLFAFPAGAVIYLAFVIQSLSSVKFHEDFNQKQKIRHIQDLNYSCMRLSSEARKHTNTAYNQKLRGVMEDKSDIVESFFRGERSFLKEKIVEQTLNLVISYIKLLTNFCIRSKELSGVDVSDIANRLNVNARKLSFTRDINVTEDIRKVINMDEKIIERLKEEKKDLERINTKLDYMESTVSMFKHQIISSIESEEMLETLETVVNEASALDSVLQERRKNKINM